MKDDQVEEIFKAMPGGIQGFCKGWGYLTFAREVLKAEKKESDEAMARMQQMLVDTQSIAYRYSLGLNVISTIPVEADTVADSMKKIAAECLKLTPTTPTQDYGDDQNKFGTS